MNPRAPFAPSEILLLGPGPSPVHPEVARAMSAPLLGHLDPEFLALMGRVQTDLREVLGTANQFTLPISGTGSAGMEAAIVNLVEPGDRIVVGVHGVFGARIAEMARRQGGDVVTVTAPMGSPLDEDAMAAAICGGPTRLCAFVHVETSTGVLQPFERIATAARDAGALLLADCVTSLGGLPLRMDEHGIDVIWSGTQKCLSVPPGLAPLSLSAAARRKVEGRARPPASWYLDAGLLSAYWREQGERAYHHTAPIAMVYALERGLDLVLDEGLDARAERHRDASARLHAAVEVLGLHNPVAASHRAPMLTPLTLPLGVDDLRLRLFLREVHRIEIGAGLGEWKGRVVRIGLMGEGAVPAAVLRVVAALGDALGEQGVRVDVVAALRAARGTG